MGKSTTKEIVSRINRFQSGEDAIHPLTCGNDSMHPNLEPRIQNGQVVLVCPHDSCQYRQTHIPNFFL